MKRSPWLNWKVILMALAINTFTIALTSLLLPGIVVTDHRLVVYVALAVGLGLLNTFVKPLIQLATIRLLFVTYGLVLVIVNALLLWLLTILFRDIFVIQTISGAILGGIIIGLLGSFLDYILGVLPPLGYTIVIREQEALR